MDLNYYSLPKIDEIEWIPSGIVFVWPRHIDEFTHCRVNWRMMSTTVGKFVNLCWTQRQETKRKNTEPPHFIITNGTKRASQLDAEKTHRKWKMKFKKINIVHRYVGVPGARLTVPLATTKIALCIYLFTFFIIIISRSPHYYRVHINAARRAPHSAIHTFVHMQIFRCDSIQLCHTYANIQRPIKINTEWIWWIAVWTLKWFADAARRSLYTTCTRAHEIQEKIKINEKKTSRAPRIHIYQLQNNLFYLNSANLSRAQRIHAVYPFAACSNAGYNKYPSMMCAHPINGARRRGPRRRQKER